MVGKHSGVEATSVASVFAVLLLLVLSAAGTGMKKSYAIASPPQPPSWLLPGEYIEYNQTYTIAGLTASINVKDTVLNVSGAADMRIERFGPQLPKGFPEPGLVATYDSANGSQVTTVVTSANGTVRTYAETGQTFTTDLTLFVTQSLLASTNATLESVRVRVSGGPNVQAWRVDETRLYSLIGGEPAQLITPVNPSLVWFEKNTLMKVRESTNYTDPSHNYVSSVETMEETNIPQLESALASQESSPSSSTTIVASLSPGYELEAAVLVVVVVVAATAILSNFAKAKQRDSQQPTMEAT